jgi:hypothetical protein
VHERVRPQPVRVRSYAVADGWVRIVGVTAARHELLPCIRASVPVRIAFVLALAALAALVFAGRMPAALLPFGAIDVLGAGWIAVAMVRGPAAGLALVDAVADDARLAGRYRVEAVRAHLLERLGDRERAVAHCRAAAERTASIPERDHLLTKAARLEAS